MLSSSFYPVMVMKRKKNGRELAEWASILDCLEDPEHHIRDLGAVCQLADTMGDTVLKMINRFRFELFILLWISRQPAVPDWLQPQIFELIFVLPDILKDILSHTFHLLLNPFGRQRGAAVVSHPFFLPALDCLGIAK